MTLFIDKLELTNFRSYSSFSLCDIYPMTIFIGPNAVGKTNLIEAIDLLTGISSFRNARNSELVKDDQSQCRVYAHAQGDNRSLDFEMVISDGKKRYLLNGKEKQARSLRGMIPSVVFTPDDLLLIKGSNSNRRQAVDSLGAQLNVNYPIVKRDYEQILHEKNNLLKENPQLNLLDSFDEVLITCGTQLFCYRVSLFNKLLPYIQSFYYDISHREEKITACYLPSWAADSTKEVDPYNKEEIREAFYQAIQERKAEEAARRHAVVGPHADKISFAIDGRDASTFASQGQQRSLVLAWKLAEVALIEEMLDSRPVLLLDDVMSELDELRRTELTKYVLRSTQTFITTTNRDYFSDGVLSEARFVELPIKQGEE